MFGTKFRPLTFSNVLGLDSLKDILRAYVRTGDYDPAYLFEGEYSCGKTTLGRIFARAILCENRKEDMSPCNECFSCREFLSERSLSYLEIDAANKGTKESVQDLLEKLKYETISSKVIVLIDEAHEVSKAGKDALLLELEKENKNVIFIFCTTESNKMPPALKSRCVQFHLSLPTEDLILTKLKNICDKQDLKYSEDALYSIVKASNRHYRDAEISLGVISKLGDISVENTEKVVKSYDKELLYLLSTLPYDLSKALKAADYISGCMNIKDVYQRILHLLVDVIRLRNGFSFGSEEYIKMISILGKQYGNSVFPILDYLLSRQRLTDYTVFHSDLLVIHYKFLQEQFVPKETLSNSQTKISDDSNIDKSELAKDLQYVNSRPPWEREALVREMKAKKLKEVQDDRVDENVSSVWGMDEQKNVASDKMAVLKGEISKKNFGEALKESLNEGKI